MFSGDKRESQIDWPEDAVCEFLDGLAELIADLIAEEPEDARHSEMVSA